MFTCRIQIITHTSPLSPRRYSVTLGGWFSVSTSPSPLAPAPLNEDGNPSDLHHPVLPEHDIDQLRQQIGADVLETIQATGQSVDDGFLSKWVVARGPDAASALIEHAQWRESFVGRANAGGGISEESIRGELVSKKIFMTGVDPAGCAVLIFQCQRHTVGLSSPQDTVRLLAYAIDAGANAADTFVNPQRKVTCIFDMAGVSVRRNVDVVFLQELFSLLQKHYPQTLHKLYFVDAPILFSGVWGVVSNFINAHTRSKISFISGVHGKQQLLDAVGADILPEAWGGRGELTLIDVAVEKMRRGQRLKSCVAPVLFDAAQKKEYYYSNGVEGERHRSGGGSGSGRDEEHGGGGGGGNQGQSQQQKRRRWIGRFMNGGKHSAAAAATTTTTTSRRKYLIIICVLFLLELAGLLFLTFSHTSLSQLL